MLPIFSRITLYSTSCRFPTNLKSHFYEFHKDVQRNVRFRTTFRFIIAFRFRKIENKLKSSK